MSALSAFKRVQERSRKGRVPGAGAEPALGTAAAGMGPGGHRSVIPVQWGGAQAWECRLASEWFGLVFLSTEVLRAACRSEDGHVPSEQTAARKCSNGFCLPGCTRTAFAIAILCRVPRTLPQAVTAGFGVINAGQKPEQQLHSDCSFPVFRAARSL